MGFRALAPVNVDSLTIYEPDACDGDPGEYASSIASAVAMASRLSLSEFFRDEWHCHFLDTDPVLNDLCTSHFKASHSTKTASHSTKTALHRTVASHTLL